MLQNRVECQLRNPCVPRTAREHAHCLCRHTPGLTPDQIAAQAGIPLKRLMKISAPMGDAHARIEEIAAVTRVTGRTGWLRFYVRDAGCELFQLPNLRPGDDGAEVLEQTSASLKSLSMVVEMLRAITEDRRIQVSERTDFDAVVGEHFACVRRLQAWVDARAERSAVVELPGARRVSCL